MQIQKLIDYKEIQGSYGFFHKNIKRGKRSYIKEILNLSDQLKRIQNYTETK